MSCEAEGISCPLPKSHTTAGLCAAARENRAAEPNSSAPGDVSKIAAAQGLYEAGLHWGGSRACSF